MNEERINRLEKIIQQNEKESVSSRVAINSENPLLVRNLISETFIRGKGIEIGAFTSPLPASPEVSVIYIDKYTLDQIKQNIISVGMSLNDFGIDENAIVKSDLLDNGEELSKVGDNTQDFVIANHVLEHFEDPIKGFKNILRVTKHFGFIYLALPDMRRCFDRNRKPTSLEHIFRDYDEGPEWSRDLAYQEFGEIFVAEGMDKGLISKEFREKRSECVSQYSQQLKKIHFDIHFHAWTADSMLQMFCEIKARYHFSFEIKLMLQNQDEVIFVFQKTVPQAN